MSKTRMLNVWLDIDDARFLDQERVRLQNEIGKPFSAADVIHILIAQHRTKMEMVAESNPDAVAWMYRNITQRAG